MTIKRINGEFSVCKLRDYSEVDLNAKYFEIKMMRNSKDLSDGLYFNKKGAV